LLKIEKKLLVTTLALVALLSTACAKTPFWKSARIYALY